MELPIRLKRLIKHIAYPFYRKTINEFPPEGPWEWMGDLPFYLMDTLAVPEIYHSLFRLFKWNTRHLTREEIEVSKSIFGDMIDYNLVKVDNKARFGTKKTALAYVSFNTINYLGKIAPAIFIHEMVHVWQYQRFGSIYIARAIKAQRSKAGYDYGGVSNLYQIMIKGGSLLDFNFEQQADIIEDYYKMLHNQDSAGPMNLSIYEYFVREVRGDV
ncbi:MAG: hypothetical protein H7X99_00635 [Saprospiraceae bacterium]|nr:hypothetical protein [Saprospiraceae bacterium]